MSVEPEEPSRIFMLISSVLVLCFFIGAYLFLDKFVFQEYDKYKEYKIFCEERPDFCYCDFHECSYKSSKTCVGSVCTLSKESQELCDLATRLEDKEMIFKAC